MPSFENTRRVAHNAQDMFRLVADVENYPHFVPLCQALVVRGRKPLTDGREVLVADMTAAYKVFKETFSSRVLLDPESSKILVEYLDGPFKHLENHWQFIEVGEKACDVHFYINYEFKSRTLGAMMGAMFDRAFAKFSEAFEARANLIYKPAMGTS
ncbi:type II toxin-antitoxin system RatA family toxin [Polycladidibacter hongkongensis]|uniref:type II toxin-antitoxin system RatA family toxin n=1 Tax=Polycladidibacter hongkongensis TaxID=1647556 RepID=UPI0009E6F858|nr:type II toxin-antitoxin system RatA family toxin [Pseudovibrio hongkongensis]